MFDKLQFIFKKYYDRTIHSYLVYDGKINKNKVISVISSFYKQFPLFHSSYHNGSFKAYWVIQDYDINEAVSFKASDNLKDDALDFLVTNPIHSTDNIQFKVKVIYNENRFVICFLINHMIVDGGDFKYLMNMFIKAYNSDEEIELKDGSRSHLLIYSKMDIIKKSMALTLYKNITSSLKSYKFNFTKKSNDEKADILISNFSKEESDKLLAFSKENKVSITDIFLASYGFTAKKYVKHKLKMKFPIQMQSMVDLRRYIDDKDIIGLSNQTGMMHVEFSTKLDNLYSALKEVNRVTSQDKNDGFIGLNALPLLCHLYKRYPNKFANLLISNHFNYADFSLSNIGILDSERLKINGCTLIDGHMSGACQKKKKIMLSITSLNNRFTMSIPYIGNIKDKKILESFLNDIKENILVLIESTKTN